MASKFLTSFYEHKERYKLKYRTNLEKTDFKITSK